MTSEYRKTLEDVVTEAIEEVNRYQNDEREALQDIYFEVLRRLFRTNLP